jgi:hypothetical protein
MKKSTYWKTLEVVLSIAYQQDEHIKGDKTGEAYCINCKRRNDHINSDRKTCKEES